MPLEVHTDWQMLAAYFKGIGVLVEEGLLDVDLVEKLFAGRIIAIWKKLFPEGLIHQAQLDEARKIVKDPLMHDHFEYIYNLMKQRAQHPSINS
jgi:hypothetical protein